MTREEFHAAFPYDIYGDENNPATWGTAAVFMDKTMNTAKDSIIRIGSPKPGSYKLTLSVCRPLWPAGKFRDLFHCLRPRLQRDARKADELVCSVKDLR